MYYLLSSFPNYVNLQAYFLHSSGRLDNWYFVTTYQFGQEVGGHVLGVTHTGLAVHSLVRTGQAGDDNLSARLIQKDPAEAQTQRTVDDLILFKSAAIVAPLTTHLVATSFHDSISSFR